MRGVHQFLPKRPRRAQGQAVYGEVLHNYLCFTAENYKEPDGAKYQTYPALKTELDRMALWDALSDGTLSTVATDEYTTSYKIKTQGKFYLWFIVFKKDYIDRSVKF